MGYIYRIFNRVTKKSYIGQTIKDDPQKRWRQHLYLTRKNKGCPALRDAIKKYGVDSFKFQVLIICFDDDLDIYEKEYIKKYNSIVPYGYNILDGGPGGPLDEKTKQKIRDSVLKYYNTNNSVNKVNIEKHREAMCKSVGRSISQYTNEGIFVKSYPSIAQAGRESGVKKPNIQHCLKGTHQYAGGYVWRYTNEA